MYLVTSDKDVMNRFLGKAADLSESLQLLPNNEFVTEE